MNHEQPKRVPAPSARPGLRLLCLLRCEAGAAIVQPVAVSRLPAPWAPLQGKWSLALPAPLLLREARPRAPSAEVLARYSSRRKARAIYSDGKVLRVMP